jgi:hypothetical protein
MKHVELAVAFVAVLLSAAVALGQTPPPTPPPAPYNPYSYSYAPTPTPQPWYYDAMAWLNLSPVTKKKLYDNDPTVCQTDECRRARLAAGIEYMGYKPYRVPTPGLTPIMPPVYTPYIPPRPVYTPPKPRGYGGFYIYCRSTNSVITRDECPDK